MTAQELKAKYAAWKTPRTIAQPTAQLTDAEAAERGEALRSNGKRFASARISYRNTPEFRSFATEWQDYMAQDSSWEMQ